MSRKNIYFICTIFLIFALVINLMQVNVVHADDGGTTPTPTAAVSATDPPTTTEVATEATPTPTEALAASTQTNPSTATEVTTSVPTETLVESTPTSPSTATETATEATSVPSDALTDTPASSDITVVPTESTPAPNPNSDATPTDTSANTDDTEPSLVLSQVPDQTDIVVLDENGVSVSLASQDAADALQSSDPVWCPASVATPTPGLNGCSASYASITDLLTAMRTNPASFSQDGTIFLEKPNGQGFTTPLILDDSAGSLDTAYAALSLFNLSVIGGWNGDSPGTFSGQTTFGSQAGNQGYISIGSSANPWVGNITLQNLHISGISDANAVTVYTTSGDITLSNVDVDNQSGNNYTAYLDTQTGDITVGDTSYFDGNNTGTNYNQGFHASSNSGAISITGTGTSPTFQDARGLGATNYNGATLSAPTVTLNNVMAQDNDGNGIYITNADVVTLNNVIGGVNQNGQGNGYSGVFVDGTGSTVVNITGGSFNRNNRYGVEVINGTINELSTPTCSGNTLGTAANPCYNISPNTPPTITVNDITVEANTLGGWTLAFGAIGTASDAEDGTPSVSCTPAIGSTLLLGTTNVSCTATDSGGLTATSSGNVTVVDTTAPVIAPHADVTVEATSAAGAVANYASPTTSDAVDGAGTATCLPTSGASFALGDTTVTCNATDTAGNAATPTTFVVHVVDSTAPVIAPHADITAEATSASGAVVNYTSPSTTDAVDGPGTATCLPTSGASFALGDTTVTCNATDTAGNAAAPATFVIHIVDTTAPVIAAHADVTSEATSAAGAVVNYTSPSTTDTADGPGTATCVPAPGSTFALGDTTVTCNATDSAGNAATPTTFVVHILDSTAPVIAAHADVTAEATSAAGAVVNYTGPATSDAVDGPGTATCAPASGNLFALGDTTITCNATDTDGNAATPTFFVVHVVDTSAPVIAPHVDITSEATSAAGAVVNYTSPATSDAVDGPGTATCTPTSGITFALGDTTITCNAADTAGNASTPTTFVVHIVDTSAPVIAPHADVTITTSTSAGMTVAYTSPATSDTVDGAGTATCSPSSGSLFPVGATLVTCNAADSHGNLAVPVTFYVIVNYVPTPVVTPPGGSGNNGNTGDGGSVVGGNLLDLDCFTVANYHEIKITFHNLCGYQAMFTNIDANSLPGSLPAGETMVKGLNLTVLFNGQLVSSLPYNSGIQLDYPIPTNTQDQYAVLLWYKEPGEDGQWLEVTQLIKSEELSKVLSLDSDDELYKIAPTDLTSQFYQILTTDLTGTFVIVKK